MYTVDELVLVLLALIGASWIFYVCLLIEESVMRVLTGKSVIDHIVDFIHAKYKK